MKHFEDVAGGSREANLIAMIPEGHSAEAFNRDDALQMHEGFKNDLYGIDNDWTEESNAESALRQSQLELRQLSIQLLNIQEKERQRIAADLHDGIGQSLSLIKLSMESAAGLMISGEGQAAVESLQQAILKVKDAMSELRRATSDLRPPMLDDLGIIATMTWFFREFEFACREVIVEKHFDITECDVPIQLKATIFRILQEAMNNIVKHAEADWVRVCLKKEADGSVIQFSVEDNGHGFDPDGLLNRRSSDRGFGLLTMKERARSSDGTLEIRSAIGRGTQILVTWRIGDGAANAGGGMSCAHEA